MTVFNDEFVFWRKACSSKRIFEIFNWDWQLWTTMKASKQKERLLELRELLNFQYRIKISLSMGTIFCVELQSSLRNTRPNILPMHREMQSLLIGENLPAHRFTTSLVFLKCSQTFSYICASVNCFTIGSRQVCHTLGADWINASLFYIANSIIGY